MKENKNIVFALKSFKNTGSKETPQWARDGVLLFAEHTKAVSFLEMCQIIEKNHNQNPCHYETHGWVKVSDFIGDRTAAQKHFYVGEGNYEELSEDDVAQMGASLNVN
jgi:hypothetical protein